MKISVIVCTYNRCGELEKALASVAVSKLPSSIAWEVLVVDNNSNDQTRAVVEGFCAKFPELFRYIFEPQPGKSYALNRGILESRGDVLAFMDDDVTVEPLWLQNLTSSLDGGEWAGSGGRTLLATAFNPPSWLALQGPHSLGGVLAALFDLGDQPCQLAVPPFGANMAIRKAMFEKYGGYRTDLGPSPNRDIPRPNEDAEMGRRLFAAGEKLRYEPSAVVYHPLPENRVKKEYFLAWWYDYGRATIREIGRRPDVWGIPRRYTSITKIIGTVLVRRGLEWMLAVDPARRFFAKCFVWMTAGQISEIHKQWRDRKTPGNAIQESAVQESSKMGCDARISH